MSDKWQERKRSCGREREDGSKNRLESNIRGYDGNGISKYFTKFLYFFFFSSGSCWATPLPGIQALFRRGLARWLLVRWAECLSAPPPVRQSQPASPASQALCCSLCRHPAETNGPKHVPI